MQKLFYSLQHLILLVLSMNDYKLLNALSIPLLLNPTIDGASSSSKRYMRGFGLPG